MSAYKTPPVRVILYWLVTEIVKGIGRLVYFGLEFTYSMAKVAIGVSLEYIEGVGRSCGHTNMKSPLMLL